MMKNGFQAVDIPADSETKMVKVDSQGWERQLTQMGDGWRVVGFMDIACSEPEDYTDQRGYNNRRQVMVDRPHALLARTVNAAEADERRREQIREELEKGLVWQHEHKVKQLTTEIEELAKITKDRDEKIAGWMEKCEAISTERDKLHAQKRKLEEDLAKVRTGIGTVRWKEILKDDES